MKRVLFSVMLVLTLAAAVAAAQPPAGKDDFVPASALPPAETMPAAPMVIAAYAFVWIALVGYLWFIWRRLQKVERDVADLERRVAGR
jgi:CcmD family protein